MLAPKTAPARRTRAEPASHEGLPATPPQFCPRSHESTSPGDAVSAQSTTAATSDDKAASSYAKWQADGNSGTGASTAAWLSGVGGALVNNLDDGDPSGGRFTQLDLHGNPLRADDQYTATAPPTRAARSS